MTGTQDTFERYLHDICRHPRISADREAALSRIIQHEKNEEQVEAAIDELVTANLRLVVHCAKQFEKFLNSSSVCITKLDLIAEGNIGLMDAAKRFDAGYESEATTRPIRFSTYACKCIKSRMQRALKLGRFIHIPEHHFTYWSAMDALRNEHGENVSDDVLHKELDVSPEVLQMLKQSEASRTFMLDDMMSNNDEEGGFWQDVMPDATSPCPSSEADASDLRAFLLEEMERLPERTREMLAWMFFSETPPTLRDLAEHYKISSERCRQVCAQGLNALRRHLEPRFERVDPVLAAVTAAA